ncbi:MAG: PQQ-binding-like beta-propeller repeat protein [Acidobacteria bacterium]|nr:PQQ-binding-like beta-propeller repeat protein [Acidobacteriota bacterium]
MMLFVLPHVWGAPEDGPAIFQKNCAMCHKDPPVNRAPLPEALMKMSGEQILASLERGSMKEQGAALTAAQRSDVAAFLSKNVAKTVAPAGLCASGYEARTDSTYWNGWGVDEVNTRFQPARMAGLQSADVPKLQMKWAFGFPGAASAMAQPVMYGGKLYFGSQDGTMFAVDAKTGCTFWTFKASSTARTAVMIGTVSNARHAVMFGDVNANVYALDARDGKLIWKIKVDDHPVARITGGPRMSGSRLYVPVSSVEEVSGGGPKYECCKFRGSVVAIDVEAGKVAWKTYTIPDPPAPTRKNAVGTQLYGPAGAAIWSAPTLDLKKRLIYVGTGNAYADPATKYSDAVIAMDMDTGAVKWVKQLAEGDGWNFACINPNKANCPTSVGPDVDIGTSPILKSLAGGKRILLVGQKSGMVHGIDPDAEGKILWQTRVGAGGALGGVQWGMAADEDNVYVALSDVHLREKAGGLFALKIATGEKVWYAPPVKPACQGKFGCSPAQMAPLTVIPGVVFSGAMDGVQRAYDATTGAIIWQFDTLREFETVNGVKAKGGSLSATGPVIAGGMMFLGSGYGALGGMAGNVLLAFGK